MRLYYDIYLSYKNIDTEDFIFYLRECILPDFCSKLIYK